MAYIGQRFSENAEMAMDRGEFPLSHWTKEEIISALPEEIQEEARKLTVSELRDQALEYEGWHHFGKYFNKVKVYSVRDDIRKGELVHVKTERKQKAEKPEIEFVLVSWTDWVGNYRKWRKPVKRNAIARHVNGTNVYEVIDRDGNPILKKLRVDSDSVIGTKKPRKDSPIWDKLTDPSELR